MVAVLDSLQWACGLAADSLRGLAVWGADPALLPVVVNLGFFVAGALVGAAIRDWLERRRAGRRQ